MRGLWTSCFIEKHDQEGFPTRFLLADDRLQCNTDREVLQEMLVLCKANPCSGLGALDNPHYKFFCRVGPGPSRTLQESARGLDPPTCHGRQVY
jgi:hypothetical protein